MEETELGLGDQNVVIPSCNEGSLIAEDPCSCSNHNIVDPNGIVLFWVETLSILGSADSTIIPIDNVGNGFWILLHRPLILHLL